MSRKFDAPPSMLEESDSLGQSSLVDICLKNWINSTNYVDTCVASSNYMALTYFIVIQ